MLIEESIKSRVRVFQRVLIDQKIIIVDSLIPVRQNFEGFRDIMKLGFGSLPMFLVFARMPLGCQLLTAIFDLKQGGTLGNPEDLVIFFERRVAGLERFVKFGL